MNTNLIRYIKMTCTTLTYESIYASHSHNRYCNILVCGSVSLFTFVLFNSCIVIYKLDINKDIKLDINKDRFPDYSSFFKDVIL